MSIIGAKMIKLVILLLGLAIAAAQTESVSETVKSTFLSNRLINMHTSEPLYAKTFEFRIGHRFADAKNGFDDMFGLDNGATMLLALDYGLTDDLRLGFSRSNERKTYEFNSQYRLFSQSRDENMPASLSVLVAFSNSTTKYLEEKYFFSQLIATRKFGKSFSLALAPYYIQRFENKERLIGAQPIYGLANALEYKINKHQAIVFEWTPFMDMKSVNQNNAGDNEVKFHSLSFGYNIEAGGHTFQIFVSNNQTASMVRSYLGTNTDFAKGSYHFGFNLTRLFSID